MLTRTDGSDPSSPDSSACPVVIFMYYGGMGSSVFIYSSILSLMLATSARLGTLFVLFLYWRHLLVGW